MFFSIAKTVTGIVTFSDGEIFLGNDAKTINGLRTGVAFSTLPYALVVASPATIIVFTEPMYLGNFT